MINNSNLPAHTYQILLIEDDVSASRLISAMLERGGYTALIANSGNEGITLALQERPDLILCDVMMPDVTGLDVLRTLQKQSDTATIPFIFLTALARQEDMRVGMELGADDYLTKPIHTEVLLNAVGSRLRRHQQLQTDRLAHFTQRLVLSQEHQRQQMASMLDNKLNQSLRSLQFVLNMLAAPAHDDATLYNGAKEMLGELILQVEGMAQEMHPTILARLGLAPTLRWLSEQFELTIELDMPHVAYQFEPKVEVCVFRLVQEALNNIQRHAQTDHAKISLNYVAPYLEVRIEDKGMGFDLERTLQSSQSMGLQYMHGLVAWANGELHITSGPGEGTAVYALLPQANAIPLSPSPISPDLLRMAGRTQPLESTGETAVTVKILLAIEQPLQLQGMHKLLARNPHFEVVGEIQDLTQVADAIETYQPQLLIINPLTEGKSQAEVLQSIVGARPGTAVLVISTATHNEYIRAAFESGVLGYIPNTATITDLHTAIMRVARKQYYVSPGLSFDLAQWQEARAD